ncbi:MAG: formate dehydrogenase subunit gamma [Helicobacter sp.]|uniref:formate dehydrogenase subunit gamma n=1 Tax=Helicobacter sp. TaxID=218 RepID=UPI0025C65626|nr:formate dehydrogenase subunit gamma [Helicobacter sp.]MCH5312977.1 formate dehydrogenase subunit gamma [Helicobacter sp.]
MQIFFRILALMLFGASLAFGANPSVPQEGGKQYAEVIEGNNTLFTPQDKANPKLYGGPEVAAIKTWGINSPHSLGLGEIFTLLQGHYFALIFLLIVIFVPMAFYGHYKIIGKRHYSHNNFLLVFSKYNIIVHWCAAVPFVMLCLSGLMMVFGDKLGGGALVRFARDLHGIATLFFAVFGTLMFLMWVKDCLFKSYDVKWMMMLGGYLDKVNREIPAHKFNAGQKMWFWVATLGGAVMVCSGAIMFFQCVGIDALRAMAIVHNFVGFLIIALLITHIYMAVFAIEGAIESILNGKMGEEEVSMLHSLYYQDLKAEGKLDAMRLNH